ncbi:MAG: winged helix-turn-helix domain-containing protein [Hyphomicrobiaceae bacterium]
MRRTAPNPAADRTSAPAAPPPPVAIDAPGPTERFLFSGFTLDLGRRELTAPDGQNCELTTAESNLLEMLRAIRAVGDVARRKIMDRLKGRDWSPLDRSIDTQVARLRRKIEGGENQPGLIKTVRNIGYVLASDVVRA